MQKILKIKIYGNVQGVLFRVSAARKAKELGLKGWVRNCPDGSVQVEAEGEDAELYQYYDWCRNGPAGAQVERTEEDWGTAEGIFSKFEIR